MTSAVASNRSVAALERAAERRSRARKRGGIAVAAAADKVDVDRRVLERLVSDGVLPFVHAEGEVWLSRSALAAYCWSRPCCCVVGCHRRVLGVGPGCSRHPHHGKRQSEETRRKKSEKMRHGALVKRVCEWDGTEFEIPAARLRQDPRAGRFCSLECLDAYLHYGEGSEERLEKLRDGRAREREWLAFAFTLGLLDLAGVAKALPLKYRRSEEDVWHHMNKGRIAPVLRIFGRPLFAPEQVLEFAKVLATYPNGKLTRFNPDTPEKARWRGEWYELRFKSTAEYGRLASLVKKPPGSKPKWGEEHVAEVRRRRELRQSLRHIAARMEGPPWSLSLKQVRSIVEKLESQGGQGHS